MAKDLTKEERDYLTKRVHSLLNKGAIPAQELLARIHPLLHNHLSPINT
jgi:hypothetical protein